MFIYEMKVKKIEAAESIIFWIILNVYILNMSAALCSLRGM